MLASIIPMLWMRKLGLGGVGQSQGWDKAKCKLHLSDLPSMPCSESTCGFPGPQGQPGKVTLRTLPL